MSKIKKDDGQGNIIIAEALTPNQIVIKLDLKDSSRKQPLKIGEVNPETRCLEIKRNRSKHLHYKSNSYGFNHHVISTGTKFDYVLIKDEYGIYKVPTVIILTVGQFLYFQQQGFERQIFLPIEQIEQYKL